MKTKGAAAMKRRAWSSMTPHHLVERALVRRAGDGADLGLVGHDLAEAGAGRVAVASVIDPRPYPASAPAPAGEPGGRAMLW